MLKKILIVCPALLALVLVVGWVLPSSWRVERSRLVRAPAEAVYAQVADPRRWHDWAPWHEGHHPEARWMYGGSPLGAGAVRSWTGGDVGSGTLSLSEGSPASGVAYRSSLDGGRALAQGRISLSAVGAETRVTWVDEGDVGGQPLLHYLVPLIQSRLGQDIDEALAGLQRVVEAAPAAAEPAPVPAAPEVAVVAPSFAPPAEPVSEPVGPPDAGADAGMDAGVDARVDAGADAGMDAGAALEASPEPEARLEPDPTDAGAAL